MSQTNARLQGGGLILPQGSSPGGVSVGERALIFDSDGVVKMQDSAGAKTVVGGNSWYDTQESFLRSAIPQLTQFERIKFGVIPSGSALTFITGASDGAIEGGALTSTNNSTGAQYQNVSWYQALKTTRWGWAIRAKFAAIAGGQGSELGFGDPAWSNFLTVGTNQASDATHFMFRFFDGAVVASTGTSVVADTNWHTFALRSDATAVTCSIDGVDVGSTSTLTRLTDGARFFGAITTASGAAKFSRMIVGFVDP